MEYACKTKKSEIILFLIIKSGESSQNMKKYRLLVLRKIYISILKYITEA